MVGNQSPQTETLNPNRKSQIAQKDKTLLTREFNANFLMAPIMALVLGTIGVVMSIRKVPESLTLNPRPQLVDCYPAFRSILPRKVQSQTPKPKTLNPQPGDLNPQAKRFHQGQYISGA